MQEVWRVIVEGVSWLWDLLLTVWYWGATAFIWAMIALALSGVTWGVWRWLRESAGKSDAAEEAVPALWTPTKLRQIVERQSWDVVVDDDMPEHLSTGWEKAVKEEDDLFWQRMQTAADEHPEILNDRVAATQMLIEWARHRSKLQQAIDETWWGRQLSPDNFAKWQDAMESHHATALTTTMAEVKKRLDEDVGRPH